MIEILLEKHNAYKAKNRDVYFKVSSYEDYYKFSGRKKDELESEKENKNKSSVEDFALWKAAKQEDPEGVNFKSPFGLGRPGWHIECSAMINAAFGKELDIHAGGADLIFPHHTNEIAQSKCAFDNSNFANYWVHNGFLTIDGEKMSKSLGNFTTVNDLRLKNICKESLRLALLTTHYKKPLDYKKELLENSKKTIEFFYKNLKPEQKDLKDDFKKLENNSYFAAFIKYILDDLTIYSAISYLHGLVKSKKDARNSILQCLRFLGLMQQDFESYFKKEVDLDLLECAEKLLRKRELFKKAKDWQKADKIRDELFQIGFIIEDRKNYSRLIKK
jgi:cysteinyl-tRNA synthetase